MEEEDWWKLMDGDVFMGEDWRAPWAKKGDGDEDDYEEVSLTTADIGSWSLRGSAQLHSSQSWLVCFTVASMYSNIFVSKNCRAK